MSDLVRQQGPAHSNAMAIATTRQSADSQTQMIAAKHYPRDENAAMARILRSCERKGLAEAAVYSFQKGDGVIDGASIRLAEVIAQNWGNMNFGFTVLDSSETESQVMAFAWDLETNTQRQLTFPVSHLRVTKTASWLLTNPRDIYEAVANAAARRVRSCILAIIPGDIVEAALQACDETMNKTTGKDLPARIVEMVKQFSEIDITIKMIEARLQTPKAAWTSQQIIAMGRLFLALRDGFLKREEIPEFADQHVAKAKPEAEHRPADQPTEAASKMDQPGVPTPEYWNHQWKTAAKTVGHTEGDPHVLIEFARRIREAATVDHLDEVIHDAKQNIGKEPFQFSQKFMIRLQEYRDWRAMQIQEVAA